MLLAASDPAIPESGSERMLWESLIAIDECHHYNSWLASHFLPYLKGDVIEIGSGIGTLAGHYDSDSVRTALLTDISLLMLKRLESRFAQSLKCQIREFDILMPAGLPTDLRGRFNCAICLNVLEHISDDKEALRRMFELLKPAGQVLLFVPAMLFLYGSIDRAAGHFRRYSKEGLTGLASAAGFTTVSSYYVNFFGILTWFISSRILKRQDVSPSACRILNKIVPVLRLLESGPKPPFGQSLVYIGQKK